MFSDAGTAVDVVFMKSEGDMSFRLAHWHTTWVRGLLNRKECTGSPGHVTYRQAFSDHGLLFSRM